MGRVELLWAGGAALDLVEAESARLDPQRLELRVDVAEVCVAVMRQAARALRGLTRSPVSLTDDAFSEDELAERWRKQGPSSPGSLYHVAKLLLGVVFEDGALADVHAKANEPDRHASGSTPAAAEFAFLHALRLAARSDGAKGEVKRDLLARLDAERRQLAVWAAHCAEGFGDALHMIEAEIARIEGREAEASGLHERAIRAAQQRGSLRNEAIACELAARLHLARGRSSVGMGYLREARDAYARWGAVAKVRLLDQRCRTAANAEVLATEGDINVRAGALDAMAVIKASQAISTEIQLESLLQRLLRTVLEHAGANAGTLVLLRDGQAWLEAGLDADHEITQRLPLDLCDRSAGDWVPRSVLAYVQRTREAVVLDDAAREGLFSADPYVLRRQLRSLLCLPMIRQGALVGMLCLENDLTPRAFSPDRVAVLEVLASQAAISIDNATLYEELERRVDARTRELREQGERLERALAEQRRMQARLVQAQKLEAIGSLAAGMAHEVNTPCQYASDNVTFLARAFEHLGAIARAAAAVSNAAGGANIVELARVLKKAKLDFLLTEGPRAIEQTREGLGRIANIVGAMKEFSHPSGGEKDLVDLSHLISTTLTVATNEWRYVATVEPRLDADLPLVPALRNELGQAFLNLVVNAAHAIADATKGGAEGKGTITVTTRGEDGFAIIEVSDTGTGIPEGIRERIFDPFFTTKPVGKGTGQGLAIVHNVIVERHGGSIDVRSEVGRGTTFTVKLPLGS
jgi:signal transduction histidine kinase